METFIIILKILKQSFLLESTIRNKQKVFNTAFHSDLKILSKEFFQSFYYNSIFSSN